MKPLLLKIPLDIGQSFSIKTDLAKKFYNQWHYHAEVELLYIVEGSGTALIGDRIKNIKSNDLILIGSNLPHLLKSDLDSSNPEAITETLMLHFSPELLKSFLNLPENKNILNLLENAKLGLNIIGETKKRVLELVKSISYVQKTQRLIQLFQILNLISESKDIELLSTSSLKIYTNKQDEVRLNRIYHYTLNNFTKEITLEEIADVVHMAPHSFCRYFKSRTKKRYSLFLLEVKVSHACKLLIETDFSIAVISYESGFMNFSNFNRHFKAITGKTPLEYRKYFHIQEKML
ncbi:bifunctional transcriptional activator/DNA repair enzyme AdaA [Pedobacter glucosidilyticus]|nr:AraC family transcriptional regulator [Pedobacter glucosidilyticus]KHJ39425.1 bifunctional transcriptional activator/DNA repair enzyme AdaA [Pedobacter glucosidilyticus]